MSDRGVTCDLEFSRLIETRDFILAVSEAALKCKANFMGLNNPRLISTFLIRAKLKKLAKLKKVTLAGLFARAIFLTLAQTLPEEGEEQIEYKSRMLNKYGSLCLTMGYPLSEQDVKPMIRLSRSLALLEIFK